MNRLIQLETYLRKQGKRNRANPGPRPMRPPRLIWLMNPSRWVRFEDYVEFTRTLKERPEPAFLQRLACNRVRLGRNRLFPPVLCRLT